MDRKLLPNLSALALLSALILAALCPAQQMETHGSAKKTINKIIHLAPPSTGAIEPGATGIAKIFVKTKGNVTQRFQVVGANLKAGATYTLFVTINGAATEVATQMAAVDQNEEQDRDEGGAAVEFIFAKKAKGKIGEDEQPLPAPLDPITEITAVALKDSAGNVILSGEFPH